MNKDLEYYRSLPYEREWTMRDDAGVRYFVVRLKDLPAVAGDGSTRDEAAQDLREAFDEFVATWLAGGRDVPEPKRAFSVPPSQGRAPLQVRASSSTPTKAMFERAVSWADNAVLYENDALVEEGPDQPRLSRDLKTAAAG